MIRFLLIGLAVLIIARSVWRFLVAVVDGAVGAPRRRTGPPERKTPLARDPVCGTFVVPGRALTASDGGQLYHFCSEECRRTFQAGGRR